MTTMLACTGLGTPAACNRRLSYRYSIICRAGFLRGSADDNNALPRKLCATAATMSAAVRLGWRLYISIAGLALQLQDNQYVTTLAVADTLFVFKPCIGPSRCSLIKSTCLG